MRKEDGMKKEEYNQALVLMARQLASISTEKIHADQATIYNFAVCVLYALHRAIEWDYFAHRPNTNQLKERKLLEEMKQFTKNYAAGSSDAAMSPVALGGFYLNDAIFRMAACFELAGRFTTGRKGYVRMETLMEETPNLPEHLKKAWSDVDHWVGTIKHGLATQVSNNPTFKQVLAIGCSIPSVVEYVIGHEKRSDSKNSN